MVIVALYDGSLYAWDICTTQRLWTMKTHDEFLWHCVISGADKVITSSSDGTFAVSNLQIGNIEWKKRLGAPMRIVDRKWAGGFGTAFAVWDEKIAVGTNDGRMVIFELFTG